MVGESAGDRESQRGLVDLGLGSKQNWAVAVVALGSAEAGGKGFDKACAALDENIEVLLRQTQA